MKNKQHGLSIAAMRNGVRVVILFLKSMDTIACIYWMYSFIGRIMWYKSKGIENVIRGGKIGNFKDSCGADGYAAWKYME